MAQVFSELTRYFSRLDRQVAEKTIDFQKQWFLSFLSSNAPQTGAAIEKLNLEQEKQSLENIFDLFEMSPNIYREKLNKHFSKISELQKRSDGIYRGIDEITHWIDTVRLHNLVEQWQKLQNSQKIIYRPKVDFMSITSDMLYKKKTDITRGNQVIIVADEIDDKSETLETIGDKIRGIPISSLSSGEKQLLIFLSETLLQEGKPRLFLADEPELSLHVEWQEELVPNLLRINPNAQVIFATHSPDIVGGFQDCVIEMEKIAE